MPAQPLIAPAQVVEPHDAAGTFDGIVADQDAADLLREELWFASLMDRSRADRLRVHNETRRQIAHVTGRMPASYWTDTAGNRVVIGPSGEPFALSVVK